MSDLDMGTQPKLKWTRETAVDCDGERATKHDHWYAQIGEEFVWQGNQHVARLRYCARFHDLFLVNEEYSNTDSGIGLFELALGDEVDSKLDIPIRLVACESICFAYLQTVFSALLGTLRA